MLKLGRAIIILTLLLSQLIAGVQNYVDKNSIQVGEQVILTLEADSNDVNFPNLREIAGYPVLASPTSKSMRNINGATTISNSRKYIFAPTNSMVIPKMNISVDGTQFTTNPIAIAVSKRAQTTNKPYKFTIEIDNSAPFENEPIMLTASLTIANYLNLENIREEIERIQGFIIKPLDEQWMGARNNSEVRYQKRYLLYPQNSGPVTIPNQAINLFVPNPGSNPFFRQSKQLNAFSNELSLEVKPLPNGVSLLGDFKMDVNVDTTIVDAKKPVNLEIVIEGEGNLDSFEPFSLAIENTTIFDDKPVFSNEMKNGKLYSKVILKYAIIADKSYNIEPFILKYLHPKSGVVKTLKSKRYKIKVKQILGKANKPELITGTSSTTKEHDCPKLQKVQSESTYLKWLMLLFGIMLGVLLAQLFGRPKKEKSRKVKNLAVEERIKKAKRRVDLIAILLPYIDQPEVELFVRELENMDTKRLNKKIKATALKLFEREL
jgi:hypothetical protein